MFKKFLKGFGVVFFSMGTFTYAAMAIESLVNSEQRDFLGTAIFLTLLMGFFLYLLLRKKKPNKSTISPDQPVSEIRSIDATQSYAHQQDKMATVLPETKVYRVGIGDLFKAPKNKALKERVSELEAILTPEMKDYLTVQEQLKTAQSQYTVIKEKLDTSLRDLDAAKADLIEVRDEILLQSFGLYKPTYDFAASDLYKDKLDDIRQKQKAMIKAGTAATGATDWSVNGSKSEGQKMVKDMQKLLIRAFNSECDELISKVKFNNIESCVKRITASKDAISKLGRIMHVAIHEKYYKLKIEELTLAYEYQCKKQEEKEEQKRIREELREQAKLAKEIEEARQKIQKEQKHYRNALSIVEKQLSDTIPDELRKELLQKKEELVSQIEKLEESEKQVDYRAANQKAGYVYVISNIGAFGENVYKIGMTRRLEPQDRIDELGDASVPFQFDVHAMIFSEDAPKLEAALHHAFEDRKVNMVNTRREFFNVSLGEIEEVVRKNYDKTVEFIRTAPAEQYRESLKIKEAAAL